MRNREFSVAMTDSLNRDVTRHLIRSDQEEDLIFGLWSPSRGEKRLTALLHTQIPPLPGDRQRHGNASFNPSYFERVCKLAMETGCGVAFMHSHPFPGWQDMSKDDIVAEMKMMKSVAALTNLPLVGMTTGSDGYWSARFWTEDDDGQFKREWCTNVRVVGKTLRAYFNDGLVPPPQFNEMFRRTVVVWGEDNHRDLARLRIGIVGLGSVGGAVALCLARMGLTNFVYIDFDEIQPHNLDRLEYALQKDIGYKKIDIAKEAASKASTASHIAIDTVPFSVVEESGYKAALDCDVIFCCVDRPRPRSILNHFAYAHLVPVVDGGIDVRFKDGRFSGVDWQLQTAGPGRTCLACVKAFSWDDVATEIEGKLDDPSYIKGLPETHKLRRNENVYPFSQNLASLEALQFVALCTSCADIDDFGVQRFRYVPGILESDITGQCKNDCDAQKMIAKGDTLYSLFGTDCAAEKARERQRMRT